MKKIVVAYSGGLDTSVMVKWLKENYEAEIVAVTGDLGQKSEMVGLEEKAIRTGASKAIILDLKKEFIEQYIWKALKAGALYEGVYPLATAIGRPLLAKALVDVALLENADAIAHGCTGKGNDQVRFEVGINTLAPDMKIIAPLRDWEFKNRDEEIDYAIEQNIPISITKEKPYSIDENLWGVAVECGELEDMNNVVPADAYQITVDPKISPDQSVKIKLEFEKGIPVCLNDEIEDPVEIIEYLNRHAGLHGIGRIDMIENRVVGIKSREIYEAPAATILHQAHNELEKLVLDKDTFRFKQDVNNKVANLIYDGLWFSPFFNSLMSFVDATQEKVTGEIELELYKGNINILSRKSDYSLYQKELATYSAEIEDFFDHKAAEGFVKLYGLPYKTISQIHHLQKEEEAA